MKILILDIETSPHFSAHFGRWQQNIPPEHTLYESRVICWAAKWLDKKKVMFAAEWTVGPEEMLAQMYDLLNEADAVVHFNGKKFDMKRLNTEFLRLGWGPNSHYHQIDLCQQVKKHFAFSSNRLKHLLKELELTPKLEENSNMQLWIDVCWFEDRAARTRMREYNKQDVLSTEEFYDYMLGWIDPHPNCGLYVDDVSGDKPACPNCGHHTVHINKYRTTKTRKYIQYYCPNCGKYPRGRKHVGTTGTDNGVLS